MYIPNVNIIYINYKKKRRVEMSLSEYLVI